MKIAPIKESYQQSNLIEDREFQDATLTEAQRACLKKLAGELRVRLSSYQLIYLASAVEVAANDKRLEERLTS